MIPYRFDVFMSLYSCGFFGWCQSVSGGDARLVPFSTKAFFGVTIKSAMSLSTMKARRARGTHNMNTLASTPVYCGIAGWSYPDWTDYVYPRKAGNKLQYIAAYVDMIEINSTFYRPPESRIAASWLHETETLPDFFFTAKLHQSVTHEQRLDPAIVSAFKTGLAPLAGAGRLKHLLAQFRYDFRDTTPNREHLQRLVDTFGAITRITIELRDTSWQGPEAAAFLNTLDATVAHLDYPADTGDFTPTLEPEKTDAYLRLHGRNHEAWFDRKAGRDETYNYLYPPQEVDTIIQRAMRIAQRAKSLTIVGNNHFRGKQLVNILQIKARLCGRKVRVPPNLQAHYPDELDPIALPDEPTLFTLAGN